MKGLMAEQNHCNDVIARWKRMGDGVELHLRRNGRAYFFFPATKHWKTASTGTCIEVIERWRHDAGNEGFSRMEPLA